MDPVTMIVLALAAGAAAGLKPTAEQAVKDAYAGVKALILRKYANVDMTLLERKPDSEAKRQCMREDLADAGAGKDSELLEKVNTLIKALQKNAPETAAANGIDLIDVKAAYLKAQKVVSTGTGVRVRKSKFKGGIDVSEVQAGNVDDPKNP